MGVTAAAAMAPHSSGIPRHRSVVVEYWERIIGEDEVDGAHAAGAEDDHGLLDDLDHGGNVDGKVLDDFVVDCDLDPRAYGFDVGGSPAEDVTVEGDLRERARDDGEGFDPFGENIERPGERVQAVCVEVDWGRNE